MTNLRYLATLAALLAILAQAHAQDWLNNGLVAFYPFNGNANDASGNGNNGVNAGGTFTADRFNLPNQAIYFDGINGHICTVANSIGLLTPNQPFTSSSWVRLDAYDPGGNTQIVSLWGVFDFLLAGTGGHRQELAVQKHGNPGKRWWIPLQPGVKYRNIALSWDGTGGKVYLDGVFQNLTPETAVDLEAIPPQNLAIGGTLGTNTTQTLTGAVDEVRIYNRALTSSEVAQLYAIESSPFCSPHPARAAATITGQFVSGATVLDNGCGYASPPSVRLVGGGGTGATAVALVTEGTVTNVVITSAGSGYTSAPRLLIESPPGVPKVSISVRTVNVTQTVRINHNYILEASLDLVAWTAAGPQFTAEEEVIVNEFDVSAGDKYFRLREVP